MIQDIIVARYALLFRLGLPADSTMFFHTAYAIFLCAEDPTRLLLARKWLYPKIARFYCTTPETVEENIRAVSSVIWRENRSLLERLARRALPNVPNNPEFLAILAGVLRGTPWAA